MDTSTSQPAPAIVGTAAVAIAAPAIAAIGTTGPSEQQLAEDRDIIELLMTLDLLCTQP